MRNALIEANGGKTTFNIKDIRDGKCNGVFAIIEELVNVISEEGLKGDEFFNSLVETRKPSSGRYSPLPCRARFSVRCF